MSEIDNLLKEWLRLDNNPITRQEIISLQELQNTNELTLRLQDRIVFGTAGLRARMEAGFSRMNTVAVLQASQGLASYILQHSTQLSIVIGHDHRHNSELFAQLTASAFILKGIKVYYLGSDIVATPLVPFTVDHTKLSGGVMITASHNPKDDNGYKVYWGNGCQIIPPHDHGIQELILQNLEPVEGSWDTDKVFAMGVDNGLLINRRDEMIEKYIESISEKLIKGTVNGLEVVYTPMHGVGLPFIKQVANLLHLQITVPEQQAQPDPDFPTVTFPNPEEKGALDLAMQTADSKGVALVLANDPDADRFSVAVKEDGSWRQLSGNEIGFLFADYIVETTSMDSNTYMLNSTVSSQMIKSVAQLNGFQYSDTLTGFKWIGNKAIELESQGFKVPFAFEEAIGYMFDVVHDKDGISALVVFAQLYKYWQDNNQTLLQRLQKGFEKYGYYKEVNGYYKVPNLSTTPYIFNEVIRKSFEGKYPDTIGSYHVAYWRDLTTGFESSTEDGVPVLPIDPSSQMITLILTPSPNSKEFIRFTARGSGTEPKLKVYIELKSDTESRAQELAREVWTLLKHEWFQPDKFQLIETC